MTDTVVSNLKPDPADCQCGCGLVGQPRQKKWKDGTQHVRNCVCRRCMGARNRSKGDGKARKARKALNLVGANTRHEEHAGGNVRWEAKAGAQVKPMWTAFLRAEAQSEQQRPMGDNRPFVMTAAPDGISDQLVAFRLSQISEVVIGLADGLGFFDPEVAG